MTSMSRRAGSVEISNSGPNFDSPFATVRRSYTPSPGHPRKATRRVRRCKSIDWPDPNTHDDAHRLDASAANAAAGSEPRVHAAVRTVHEAIRTIRGINRVVREAARTARVESRTACRASRTVREVTRTVRRASRTVREVTRTVRRTRSTVQEVTRTVSRASRTAREASTRCSRGRPHGSTGDPQHIAASGGGSSSDPPMSRGDARPHSPPLLLLPARPVITFHNLSVNPSRLCTPGSFTITGTAGMVHADSKERL
jgi:hypothetical protein